MGGNLCDAVSMAVKAALHSTRIPVVRVTAVDGGEPEIEVGKRDTTGELVVLDLSGEHLQA